MKLYLNAILSLAMVIGSSLLFVDAKENSTKRDISQEISNCRKLICEEPENWRYWKQYYDTLVYTNDIGMTMVALKKAIEFYDGPEEGKQELIAIMKIRKGNEEKQLSQAFPGSRGKKFISGKFKYYFQESTGQNQFAQTGEQKWPIRFDRAGSEKKELDALKALSWPVLYLNSKGLITLEGDLSKERTPHKFGSGYPEPPGSFYHNFKLKHWYLPVPFSRGIVRKESPGTIKSTEKSNSLRKDDFDTTPKLPLGRFLSE